MKPSTRYRVGFYGRRIGRLCFPTMNRRLLASALSLLAIPLTAQPPASTTPANPVAPVVATRTAPPPGFTQTIVLWPAGAPLAHGTTEGDIPKLFTYPAAGAGPHSAVIVMPGGGYTHLVMPQEGAQEAQWLAAHGTYVQYRASLEQDVAAQTGRLVEALNRMRGQEDA